MKQISKEKLKKINSDRCNLISLYIPKEENIEFLIRQLEYEKEFAKNIEKEETRKDIIISLSNIIKFLKELKVIPEKGIAVFCRNKDIWIIKFKNELKLKLFRCDNKFITAPLIAE